MTHYELRKPETTIHGAIKICLDWLDSKQSQRPFFDEYKLAYEHWISNKFYKDASRLVGKCDQFPDSGALFSADDFEKATFALLTDAKLGTTGCIKSFVKAAKDSSVLEEAILKGLRGGFDKIQEDIGVHNIHETLLELQECGLQIPPTLLQDALMFDENKLRLEHQNLFSQRVSNDVLRKLATTPRHLRS